MCVFICVPTHLWGQWHLADEVGDVALEGQGGGGEGDAVKLQKHLRDT